MHNKKTELRKQMRSRLQAMSAEDRLARSREASGYLIENALWQQASHICLFINYGAEINTGFLLQSAWEHGKHVYLPKCRPDEAGMMDFYLCRGMDDLQLGLFGIQEPRAEIACAAHALVSPDLIIIPGLAFSLKGQRLGKGAGYYDRFMGAEPYRASTRVGFAYSLQIVDEVPVDAWDLPLHYLCTDSGLVAIEN